MFTGKIAVERTEEQPYGSSKLQSRDTFCRRCGIRAAAINAKSPHIEEALKFLEYLASPEYSKIDEEIRMNLERRPDLQKVYEQQTGKVYRSDWWKS